jgi:hypothetical protein
VCPPRRPDRKGYVERLIKSYQAECILRDQPSTEEATREVTEAFLAHYHDERPHQGRGMRNLPPRVAFPTLRTRPPLPEVVDPDRWLVSIHGQTFSRTVQPNGSVVVDHRSSYIKQSLAGRKVVLVITAKVAHCEVFLGRELVKAVPIKGLLGHALPFDEYAAHMLEEARSDYRRWLQHQRRWRQGNLWAG